VNADLLEGSHGLKPAASSRSSKATVSSQRPLAHASIDATPNVSNAASQLIGIDHGRWITSLQHSRATDVTEDRHRHPELIRRFDHPTLPTPRRIGLIHEF
jgi:hypothetical protein